MSPALWGAGLFGAAVALAGFSVWSSLERRRIAQKFQERFSRKRGPFFLRTYGKKREQRERFRAFPDFLDLLALASSAGLHFEQAWAVTTQALPAGSLKTILSETMEAIRIGQSREDALRRFAAALEDDRLHGILTFIIQSLKRGIPLQAALADQAHYFREMTLRRMEKQAHTAPVRILFPLILFIFPTIFIALFAPLILTWSSQGGLW